MVAIMDADKEGFLRSETSLIQTIGRSARNVNARVILYADTVTDSMQRAIDETNRRRALQLEYNQRHGITPETIRKAIRRGIEEEIEARQVERSAVGASSESQFVTQEYLRELEGEMLEAAEQLQFERAAQLRDRIHELKKKVGQVVPEEESADVPGFARRGGGSGGSGGRGRGRGRAGAGGRGSGGARGGGRRGK